MSFSTNLNMRLCPFSHFSDSYSSFALFFLSFLSLFSVYFLFPIFFFFLLFLLLQVSTIYITVDISQKYLIRTVNSNSPKSIIMSSSSQNSHSNKSQQKQTTIAVNFYPNLFPRRHLRRAMFPFLHQTRWKHPKIQ